MGTIAVTGSAGGMGRAVRTQLERQGHEVLGVDVVDSEVTADLSNHEGREAMVEAVTDLSGGRLAGLVVAAGLQKGDPGVIVGVNHFGAVATLEGLRPLLQANGEAAAVVARVALPQLRSSPIVAGHLPTAGAGPTRAGKFVVGRAITHGIVEADFFTGQDVSHGHQANLAG